MKNLTNVVLTTAFTFLSLAASAVDIPEFTIKNDGQKSFVLYLDKVLTEKVNVRILDARQTVLLSEAIKEKGSFAKKYNLANLPAGQYTVEIEDAYMIQYQPVQIMDSSLVIEASEMKAIYKPVIISNGILVDLTFLQLEDAATKVEILDEDGFPVFQETIEAVGSITRRYNVSQLVAGEYQFLVMVNDKSYYRSFRVGGPSF